jgi:tripartite-type tricarboxylate transporter receptor subunit TctC
MRTTLLRFLLVASLGVLSTAALAQAFPSKPIRIVVPYPPGGVTDLMARALQEPLMKTLGQPVIVDNKAGAAGAIGAREVARSASDGYTLVFVNSGILSVTPFVQKNVGYDGLKDFAPVSLVSSAPFFIVINANVPANDLKSFIEYARKQPGGLLYASAGIGSAGHLASELFARAAGLKLVHVPYKGLGPTTQAVMTGEVQLLISTPSGAMNNYIKEGKLKLLALSAPTPSPLAPGVPPAVETLPGYAFDTWFALLAPAGTPPDVIAKLNDAIGRALALPEVQRVFVSGGMTAKASTPQQLHELIVEDLARWPLVVRDTGIQPE